MKTDTRREQRDATLQATIRYLDKYSIVEGSAAIRDVLQEVARLRAALETVADEFRPVGTDDAQIARDALDA